MYIYVNITAIKSAPARSQSQNALAGSSSVFVILLEVGGVFFFSILPIFVIRLLL